MLTDDGRSTADRATTGPSQARPCRGCHRHNHDRVRHFYPTENSTDCVSVIAIHGLDTESPRTWIWEKNGTQVHWLRDSDMLPTAIPEARIYTYDWNARVFDHAPVQTLLGHADNLLGQVAAERGQSSEACPLIFVASCFGGLVLAEVRHLTSTTSIVSADVGRPFAGRPKKAVLIVECFSPRLASCSLPRRSRERTQRSQHRGW